jgi:hypothetical protein
MSCVVQNSQANRICSDVIYLRRIKYVTCQFYLPVSKFQRYHHKHFSNVTWSDYLKSTAYLWNQNSAFVIMLKRQISSCNIRKLLFNTITIWYIYIKIAYGNSMSPRAVAYHILFNQPKCGNIRHPFHSDTLRVQSETSAVTFNSLAQGSLHSPFSEYRQVSALHSVS